MVEVRNGYAFSERLRERLAEESLHGPTGMEESSKRRQVGAGGWFPRSAITWKQVVTVISSQRCEGDAM